MTIETTDRMCECGKTVEACRDEAYVDLQIYADLARHETDSELVVGLWRAQSSASERYRRMGGTRPSIPHGEERVRLTGLEESRGRMGRGQNQGARAG